MSQQKTNNMSRKLTQYQTDLIRLVNKHIRPLNNSSDYLTPIFDDQKQYNQSDIIARASVCHARLLLAENRAGAFDAKQLLKTFEHATKKNIASKM
jgi:hypothetical protein